MGLIPALTTQNELNEYEFLNISEAIAWTESNRRVKFTILETATLKTLHRQMFGKTWRWAGSFRQTQKSIGVEAERIATELHNLLEDVKCWLEFGSFETREIAARFHHRLVSIHLFPNGNGRHARLATDILCAREGWPMPTWGASDLVHSSDARSRYIAALRAADGHDIQPLIVFMWS